MNERGKPEAVWPARWMAPNKTEGTNHANPPSTRARVPAPPREGRTTKQRTNGGSGGNRASETDQYYELATEPERIHRATPNVTQKLAQTQASTTVGGPGPELEGRRQRQHRTRTADNGLDGNNTAPSVPEHVRGTTAKAAHAPAHAQAPTAVPTPRVCRRDDDSASAGREPRTARLTIKDSQLEPCTQTRTQPTLNPAHEPARAQTGKRERRREVSTRSRGANGAIKKDKNCGRPTAGGAHNAPHGRRREKVQ